MTTNAPPYVALAWNATALGANFGGYNVYRRASRVPVVGWTQIAAISVPTGYTPANVETLHNAFNDYEAGWAITGGQWGDGFDYAVTVVSKLTNLESAMTAPVAMVKQTPDINPWVCNNSQPFLSFPIASLQQLDTADESAMTEYRLAGRDLAVTRTQLELPPRSWTIGSRVFARLGEDPARTWRAAAASGLPFAIQDSRGDRLIGTLETPTGIPHEDVGVWTLTGKATEVDRNLSLVSDHNLPAGVTTDGTTTVVHASTTAGDPTSVAFTFFCLAQFSNTASKFALAKGVAAGQGWKLGTDGSGKLQAVLVGSGGTATLNDAVSTYNDALHTVIVTGLSGSSAMYRDGVSVATSATAFTGITNAQVITLGALSDASAGMVLSPGCAWGFYARTLTAAEISNLDKYLRGTPGVRPPAGAQVFMDLRDQRTWDGTQTTTAVTDLSGNGFNAVLTGAIKTRGLPYNLAQIDRF